VHEKSNRVVRDEIMVKIQQTVFEKATGNWRGQVDL